MNEDIFYVPGKNFLINQQHLHLYIFISLKYVIHAAGVDKSTSQNVHVLQFCNTGSLIMYFQMKIFECVLSANKILLGFHVNVNRFSGSCD